MKVCKYKKFRNVRRLKLFILDDGKVASWLHFRVTFIVPYGFDGFAMFALMFAFLLRLFSNIRGHTMINI